MSAPRFPSFSLLVSAVVKPSNFSAPFLFFLDKIDSAFAVCSLFCCFHFFSVLKSLKLFVLGGNIGGNKLLKRCYKVD